MREVISTWVAPGTETIVTDYWIAYLQAVPVIEGVTHQRVNHSTNFVSPEGYHQGCSQAGLCRGETLAKFWQNQKFTFKKNLTLAN